MYQIGERSFLMKERIAEKGHSVLERASDHFNRALEKGFESK